MQRIQNPFPKDVLSTMKNFIPKGCPTDVGEFVSECIRYSINIIREKRGIFIKKWMDNGIFLIGHLINTDGKFLSFVKFRRKCPAITKTNSLMYEGVLKAIIQCQRAKAIALIDCSKQYQTKAWLYIEKGNKPVQSVRAGSETVPKAVEKWNKKFEELNKMNIFAKCHKCTSDTQLRWFQVRLFHRLLPTNKFMLIRNSFLCAFCGQGETVDQLFWKCDISQRFLSEFKMSLHKNCANCSNFSFSEELVLFGTTMKLL